MSVNTTQAASVFTVCSLKPFAPAQKWFPSRQHSLSVVNAEGAVPAEGAKCVAVTVESGERSRVFGHGVEATKVQKAVEHVRL